MVTKEFKMTRPKYLQASNQLSIGFKEIITSEIQNKFHFEYGKEANFEVSNIEGAIQSWISESWVSYFQNDKFVYFFVCKDQKADD